VPGLIRGREGARRGRDLWLLRYVPGTSPVHRLWAGTKLVAVVAFGVVLSLRPSWGAEGVLAGVLALAAGASRVGRGAWPRVPAWLWAGVAASAVPMVGAGGSPEVHLGHLSLGLGALGTWARFLVLTLLLVACSVVVGWTTPMGELAPALSTLLGPLRRLGLAVDELVAAVALSVRCLPLLVDELRMLNAARRVRMARAPETLSEAVRALVDMLVGALVVATRRAGEMAEAIEARGGLAGAGGQDRRPGRADALALLVVAASCAGMLVA
jgi:energy-coupling factor transporter transmembrane protein EcfT